MKFREIISKNDSSVKFLVPIENIQESSEIELSIVIPSYNEKKNNQRIY